MNNNSYWNKSNLLKGIGTLCIFIIFGYYAYQDAINRNMLERSLNKNAAPPQRDFAHKSSRLQRSSAIHGNTIYKDVAGKTQNVESREGGWHCGFVISQLRLHQTVSESICHYWTYSLPGTGPHI